MQYALFGPRRTEKGGRKVIEKDLITARLLIERLIETDCKDSVDTNLVFAIAEALGRARMEGK